MIWALLAILGVPIWLIVGALGGAVWSRRRFRSQPGVFPIMVRTEGKDSWPRVVSHGRLIRDILVVNRGLALVRTELYPIVDVRPLEGPVPEKISDGTGRLIGTDGRDLEVGLPLAVGEQLDLLAFTRDG